MSRVKAIGLRGRAEHHADAVALIPNAGDAAMVVRGGLRSVAIRCPDGCGEVISVNLDPRSGPAWKLFERDDSVTIYPSVWKESGCKAHFIVWRNSLLWCDTFDSPHWRDDQIKRLVHQILPGFGLEHAHFADLAAKLNLIPWEVLWACQSLVTDRVAVSSAKGTRFGLAPTARTSSRIDRSA